MAYHQWTHAFEWCTQALHACRQRTEMFKHKAIGWVTRRKRDEITHAGRQLRALFTAERPPEETALVSQYVARCRSDAKMLLRTHAY